MTGHDQGVTLIFLVILYSFGVPSVPAFPG